LSSMLCVRMGMGQRHWLHAPGHFELSHCYRGRWQRGAFTLRVCEGREGWSLLVLAICFCLVCPAIQATLVVAESSKQKPQTSTSNVSTDAPRRHRHRLPFLIQTPVLQPSTVKVPDQWSLFSVWDECHESTHMYQWHAIVWHWSHQGCCATVM